MLFSKIFRHGRADQPMLDDLEAPISPLGPEEGTTQRRGADGVLRVRTHLKAGANDGEGTEGTDRHNMGSGG
jgi:hypothetical protein